MPDKIHPVQTIGRKAGKISSDVTMRAYEVYCHVFAPQEALVSGGCRGGFGTGELIAFLYARSFPVSEWKTRFKEATTGMENLG